MSDRDLWVLKPKQDPGFEYQEEQDHETGVVRSRVLAFNCKGEAEAAAREGYVPVAVPAFADRHGQFYVDANHNPSGRPKRLLTTFDGSP